MQLDFGSVIYDVESFQKKKIWQSIYVAMENATSLPRSSVEVDISFLLTGFLITSMDFPLAEAFRSLDWSTFFSEFNKEENYVANIWILKIPNANYKNRHAW